MKRCVFILAILLSPLAAGGEVNLAKLDGWDIVVDANASPAERFAATELRDYLLAAGAPNLPISATADRPGRHFFVGVSTAMRASEVGFGVEGFGPEDLRYVVGADSIAIAGGRPRGTLYGVYSFLEDRLGVRFLTADHTHVPKTGASRPLAKADRTYRPPLEFRYCYYGEINRNPLLAARLRNNAPPGLSEQYGGQAAMRLINHSFAGQIPTKTYGKEHPEYFAEIDGKRRWEVPEDWSGRGTQPDVTNPDVIRIVTESVLRELARHPDWRNISVSQNDNRHYCRCANCRKINDAEGTPMGAQLALVNAVADAVAKAHPGVFVGTLSYQYTRKPPAHLRPRDNVQIQLCSIECCQIHPIDDANCPLNVPFCRDVEGWGAICRHIYVWNYNTNFSNYLLPCPNLRVVQPNVRYFVAHHARGLFMQAAGNANAAELSEMRAYLISNLMWDPNRDGQALIDEFLDLHYGPAAGPIRRYVNAIHDRAAASGVHRACFSRSAAGYGLGPQDANMALAAFAEARRLAGDDKAILARVEKASICAYRLAIEPVWRSSRDAAVLKRMRPLVAEFVRLCQTYGVDMVSEGEKFSDKLAELRATFGLREGEDFATPEGGHD